MKKIILSMLAITLLSGCLYSNVKCPLDIDFDKTELGTKVGKSNMHSVLWMVAWGDTGAKSAADNGNIKIINHADQEFLSILFGLYYKHTTIVYGD